MIVDGEEVGWSDCLTEGNKTRETIVPFRTIQVFQTTNKILMWSRLCIWKVGPIVWVSKSTGQAWCYTACVYISHYCGPYNAKVGWNGASHQISEHAFTEQLKESSRYETLYEKLQSTAQFDRGGKFEKNKKTAQDYWPWEQGCLFEYLKNRNFYHLNKLYICKVPRFFRRKENDSSLISYYDIRLRSLRKFWFGRQNHDSTFELEKYASSVCQFSQKKLQRSFYWPDFQISSFKLDIDNSWKLKY